MTRPSLRMRILWALRLAPMSCAVLARCLGYPSRPEQRKVWESLRRLVARRAVRRVGASYILKSQFTEREQ